MGARRWFLKLVDRGQPEEADPEGLVEVEWVPLASGPILVGGLKRAGIRATFVEEYDEMRPPAARIMVRRSDLNEAQAALARLR